MSAFHHYDLPSYPPKNKKPKRKKRLLYVLIGIAVTAIIVFFYFQRNVTRVLISISEATMRASTAIAVNDAVYYTLSDTMRYDDLVTVTRNDTGDIVAISANSLKINKIARDTASISQSNLKNLSLNGIPVPLGALTGIEAFAGLGLYQYLVDLAGAGATVPISGFGYLLANGAIKGAQKGLFGALTGALSSASAGISAAVIFSFLMAVIFRSRSKKN